MKSSRVFSVLAVCVLITFGPGIKPVMAERLQLDDRTLSDLAAGLAMAGRMGKARRAVNRIDRVDFRDTAMARISVVLARGGDSQAAETWLSKISNVGRRENATAEVAIALARRQQLDQAETLAFNLVPWRRDKVRAVIGMVEAENGDPRKGWATARRTNNLIRRRDSLVAVRGGLARTLTPRASLGVALGAGSRDERARSLIAIARAHAFAGRSQEAVRALSWARQETNWRDVDPGLHSQVAADTAMILLLMGDIVGAQQAAGDVRSGALRRYLMHHIDAKRNFLPYP